jgi:aromatic ring-cleaving dioxygenase
MKHFHLHIYFEPDKIERARVLAEQGQLVNLFECVKFYDHPVGPHPMGMIEIHFGEGSYAPVLDWIEAQRGEFSVLIHQDTGDDLKDHTDGSRWLGQALSLNFSFFELIQQHPELRIHKEEPPSS